MVEATCLALETVWENVSFGSEQLNTIDFLLVG